MKEINTTQFEHELSKALATYRETVSPSKENLIAILSHIPEQKNKQGLSHMSDVNHQMNKDGEGRAIRSPYMWLEVTEFVMLCSLMLVALPTLTASINDPFYSIDKEVEIFEVGIQDQDYNDNLLNSSL